jgi:phosphate transport system substrate-binding protein
MKRFSRFFTIAALLLGTVMTSCQREIYFVTYDGNGGRIEGEAVVTVKEGDRLPAWQDFDLTPPAENMEIDGWYREAEQINRWDFFDDVVRGDMTLYAGWKRIYHYTFHGNGGIFVNRDDSETWTQTYLSIGDRLYNPDNVIKPGYVLEGWYRDEALTERWDFETDIVSGDGALYAKWAETIEGLTRYNYPLVDGATSTRALNFMIACKLLGIPYVWDRVPETDELSVWPSRNGIPDYFLQGRIKTSQTHDAMMNLIGGYADIILRSTTASPAEKAAAEAAGVTRVETPIALDAFVFLKNPANSVTSLTIEQIRKIYTKQITDWSQVGGDRAPIKVFTRPRNSGSEEALRELVMGGLEPAEFPEEQQIFTMAGLMWEMDMEEYGMGYIFKNYKDMIMRRPEGREPTFAINGIHPDAVTIRNGTYPLTTEVYAIIRSDLDRGSMGYKLYEWLQTEAAKAVLEECGFLYR